MIAGLTYREYGILMTLYLRGIQATEPSLRTPDSEGRDALRASLRRLESLGYIARKKTAVGASYGYEARLTDKAIEALEIRLPMGLKTRPLLQSSELTNTSYITNLIYKEYTGALPREEKNEVNEMPGWGGMFEPTASDERLEEREAAERFKKAEYEQAKAERQGKRIIRRQDVPPARWTSSDIGYEFALRLQMTWNIKPWQISETQFIPALGEFRKKYNTNGEIELNILNMFFSSIDLNKFDNGDILWKMFIKRAPEFLTQARGMVRTEEEVEVAKDVAKRSQEWLYE